jgi:calcineurin-like phosphoesterase family protein
MDEAMVNNWNSVVGDKDLVFCLGDLALPDKRLYLTEEVRNAYVEGIIKRLRGKIIIVFGSHDKHAQANRKLFLRCHDKNTIAEYYIDSECVLMSHCPMLSWEKRAHGSLHAFGHVHTSPKHPFPCSLGSYDVGVDNNNFTPVSFQDFVIKARSQEGKLNLNLFDHVEEKA